jgi:hypothetical protein
MSIVTSKAVMEQAIFNHFSVVFEQPAEPRELRQSTSPRSLGCHPTNLSALDQPFTIEEVWAAIIELPANRALGSDGFTGSYRKILGLSSAMTLWRP